MLKREPLGKLIVWRKIDFYVLGEVFTPFLGGVAFFTFVFLMFQVLRLAEFFIVHGISGPVLFKMISLMMLSFLPTALPVAFLIGVLVGFGRLSSDSELVAMKANGISLYRLALPVTVLACVVVVLSLSLNLQWVPWGDRALKSTIIKVSNTKVASAIKEGTFTSGFFDLLIYADKLDPKSSRLQKVFIFDERDPKNPLAVVAKEGEILPVKTESELGSAIMLRLYGGNIHQNNAGESTYQKIDFGEYRLFLKIDEGEASHTIKPKMYPVAELREMISKQDPTTQLHRELRTELWRRISVALSPLVFVFFGIGFGTFRTRSMRAGATLIAFLVTFLYWATQAFGMVAAKSGTLPPWLAMQMPNLIVAGLAYYGFKSAAW